MATRKASPATKREKLSGGEHAARINSMRSRVFVEARSCDLEEEAASAIGMNTLRGSGQDGGGGGVGAEREQVGSLTGVAPGTCVAIKKVSCCDASPGCVRHALRCPYEDRVSCFERLSNSGRVIIAIFFNSVGRPNPPVVQSVARWLLPTSPSFIDAECCVSRAPCLAFRRTRES